MSKIRMNTEYRNKLYNKIKDVFEKEETQEQQAFLQAREVFNTTQRDSFNLARQVVERSFCPRILPRRTKSQWLQS